MDKIDEQIVTEIINDGRQPFRKIAEKIGISTPTAIKRYQELKKRGVIQRCVIQVDLLKLGYQGTAHLFITSSGGKNLSEALETIQKINGIIIAAKAVGDFDGYAVLAIRNIQDLYNKILQIKSLPSVSTLEFSIGIPGFQYFPPKTMLCSH